MRKRTNYTVTIAMAGTMLAAVGTVPLGRSQQPLGTGSITWPAPLEKAATLLEQRYGRPVTYEDPMLRWRGDFSAFGPGRSGREVRRTKEQTFVLPEGLTPDKTPVLGVAELNRVVEAYAQQNPERVRFRVVESGLWLEIVPSAARDESGALRPASSVLDTVISVPAGNRSPSGQLAALCQALSSASGVPIQPFLVDPAHVNPLDQYFAANGYILRGSLRELGEPLNDDDEMPYIQFNWGTGAATARSALEDLLMRSRSTLTWALDCQRIDERCFLSVAPVGLAGPGGRGISVLFLDRCHDCRPVPVRRDAQTPRKP